MNIILKNRENKEFQELKVGETFMKGSLNRVYMKTAYSDDFYNTYEHNGNAVCLDSGYLYLIGLRE